MRIITFNTFTVALLSIVMILSGCGKSADDMYIEGKVLISRTETIEEGLETLVRFEKKFPKDHRAPEALLAVATTYQAQKKYNEAVDIFKRLLEKYPRSDGAYKGEFVLGYMYYDELNDRGKAIEVFDNFIKSYPDSGLAISAKVLLENIDLPVEEWPIVKEFDTTQTSGTNALTDD